MQVLGAYYKPYFPHPPENNTKNKRALQSNTTYSYRKKVPTTNKQPTACKEAIARQRQHVIDNRRPPYSTSFTARAASTSGNLSTTYMCVRHTPLELCFCTFCIFSGQANSVEQPSSFGTPNTKQERTRPVQHPCDPLAS